MLQEAESSRSRGNHQNIVFSTKLPEIFQSVELNNVEESRKKSTRITWIKVEVNVIRNLRKYQGKVKKVYKKITKKKLN